jgi:hypothetical protein
MRKTMYSKKYNSACRLDYTVKFWLPLCGRDVGLGPKKRIVYT